MTGESGESSRKRQRRLAARAATDARVVADPERRIRPLFLVKPTIQLIDRRLTRVENIPRSFPEYPKSRFRMNRIVLRDAPPVTRPLTRVPRG